jgi:prepilin-type N-terminal cleavage/methylation domain-containing protein
MTRNISRGFTLIEILVVIGLIAILAGIVLIAINPARQFAQARNAQRTAHVSTILNAVGQRFADNKGVFTGGSPNCPAISTAATSTIYNGGTIPAGDIDLSCLVPTYLSTFPADPTGGSGNNTGYTIRDYNGRVMVCAPSAEIDVSICIQR